ncbi:putative helicase [Betalipothrixvirus pezzuloense]|uniref:Putative helicase n=1 Tax=Betalipothrixvirus pezzuloense TaxID=346883 RepID=A7WKN6_9VIRU|nr:putative helicase [Acidianus filamentous virus 7]CAJ31636.1 putative helicase [Acidianus filamentous virus 7]
MSESSMSFNNNKIPIPKLTKYLEKDEFREYLLAIKEIADFDPSTKTWYLNELKISRIEKEELKRIADFLKDYIGEEIYNILSPYINSTKEIVFAKIKGNYIYIYDDLEKYKKLLTYKLKKFDYDRGKYEEEEILLAWEHYNFFVTYRGLYWRLLNTNEIKIKPFANFSFHDITLKNFELRDYQINSIRSWLSDVNIIGTGIIKAPTGSGKSVIAIISALQMLKNKKNSKIVYAVNSTTLLKQFQQFAKREDLDFAIVSGEINELKKEKDSNLIALSISYYYSQKKRGKNDKLRDIINNSNLIIIDEAHHTPTSSIKSLLVDAPNSIRLGLTATPFREDGRDLEITGLLGRISYSINYQELVKNHYLVPLEYIPFVPEVPKKLKEKIKKLEKEKDDMEFAKYYSLLLRLFENSPGTNMQILEKIKEINSYPALIIVRRISTAKKLSELFNQNGISADYVTSQTKLEERMRKIENLKNGKIQTLIATSLADEGLDIPNLKLIILLSQGKSRIKLVQRIGRVMRPYKNKQKGIILDIAYNHEIFQRQFDQRYSFVMKEYEGIIFESK